VAASLHQEIRDQTEKESHLTKEQERRLRELATRRGDGIEVSLHWRPEDDAVVLTVADWKSGESFEIEVERDRALDAFRHPFAYVPHGDAAPE
jgi:hypothetical protein